MSNGRTTGGLTVSFIAVSGGSTGGRTPTVDAGTGRLAGEAAPPEPATSTGSGGQTRAAVVGIGSDDDGCGGTPESAG